MKKFLIIVLMMVVMMAMVSSALADYVGFNFTVYGGESSSNAKLSSFGLKSNATGTAAQLRISEISGATASENLYAKAMALDGTTEVSTRQWFYLTGTKNLYYSSGYGIQGDPYRVKLYNKSTTSPIIRGEATFTP